MATTAANSPTVPQLALVLGDAEPELASTRRVLERFPDGKGDWRPHAKSRTIGQLASHVAALPGLAILIVKTDGLDAATRPPLTEVGTAAELLAIFDTRAQELRAAIAEAGESMFDQPWSIGAGGRVFLNLPKRQALRTVFMNHLIHHRAQLGVYYRLLDIPVPILYGPTADESI
jgi:uncharacterized damage-inducible protein DinB